MSWLQWLDYSSAQRDAALDLLAAQKDKGTLDELGIGSVRDAIADHLFPPLNTIQTRAKYFLFIPWIYRKVERGAVADERLAQACATGERQLIQALLASDAEDKAGLIGREAQDKLQRLPSGIYWAGLRRLGIFRGESSMAEYLSEVIEIRGRAKHRQQSAEDAPTESVATPSQSWDVGLPVAEADLLKTCDFSFSREQATYLREKTLAMPTASGKECLLQWLLQAGGSADLKDVNFPWDLAAQQAGPALPAHLRQELVHARNFALCISGMTTLYYYFLADALRLTDLDARKALIAKWCADLHALAPALRAWHDNIEAFWSWVHLANPRLQREKPFIEAWLAQLRAHDFAPKGDEVIVTPENHRLLQHREYALKGQLARMSYPGPRSRWSKNLDGGLLSYRWPTGRQFVLDIQVGLVKGS
jgi:Family of unknown function (DUF6361)